MIQALSQPQQLGTLLLAHTPAAEKAVSGDSAWMLISAALVLLMTPALALFYGGMSRQKSAVNMMMMSFGSMGVIGVVYVLWGWSMSYGTESVAGLFANPFELFGLNGALVDSTGHYILGDNGYPAVIDVCFQITFAMIAAAIISGSLANRVKFRTWLVFTVVWVTLAYFPLAHMVWGGGILGESESSIAALLFGTTIQDGEKVAAVAPIDFAGGTVVHINAGVAALCLAIIIGHSRGFMEAQHRPHNIPLVMLGAGLLWFGWFGFNGGSAFAADGLAGLAWINTTAATCAAMIGWVAVEFFRDGRATSLGTASGLVAGLVTITPAAGDATPVTSIIMGLIGGVLAAVGVGLKYKFRFDDSLDVVGVHLVAGIWGTIAIGLFATDRGLFTGGGIEGAKLLVVQIVIALIAAVWCGVVTIIAGKILAATFGWRIPADAEADGIDSSIHGESAYDHSRYRW